MSKNLRSTGSKHALLDILLLNRLTSAPHWHNQCLEKPNSAHFEMNPKPSHEPAERYFQGLKLESDLC